MFSRGSDAKHCTVRTVRNTAVKSYAYDYSKEMNNRRYKIRMQTVN